jgi:hypothetical protein
MMFNHEDDERFLFVMAALGEATGQEPTDFKIKIYAKGLEDMPIEDIEKSAWEIMRNRTLASFPKIGELREQVNGKKQDLAVLALANLEKGIARIGRYRSAQFEDSIIMACVESMGGWIQVCSYEMREWEFKKKDFVRLYEALCSNPGRLQAPSRLVGFSEQCNDFMCHAAEPEVKKFTADNRMIEGDGDQKAIGYEPAQQTEAIIKGLIGGQRLVR